jgi:hypothetical protein
MIADRAAELGFCKTTNPTTPLPVVDPEGFNEIQSTDVLGVQAQVVVTEKPPDPPVEPKDPLPAERANTHGCAPV